MRTPLALMIGIVIGVVLMWLGIMLSGGWYEYRMLPPTECALLNVARYDAGTWTIAPNQPNGCYLRRARLSLY